MINLLYGEGKAELAVWPIAPVAEFEGMYTAFQDLPPSTKELFEYHPDRAKQLLTEAGYPNGFKTEVICLSASATVDQVSIIKDSWSKIGVDLEIQPKEAAVHSAMGYGRNYQTYFQWASLSMPMKNSHIKPGSPNNWSLVNDSYMNERYQQIWKFENARDYAKRKQLAKELTLRLLDQAYMIQMPTPYLYYMWWPWVKNYYGVTSVGYVSPYQAQIFVWLDQDLRKQMGR